MRIRAFAAKDAGEKLNYFEYNRDSLNNDEIEIDVQYCGICHSDLHMLNNDWKITQYPFVPGHEIIGKISQVGSHVRNLHVGQSVGIGWKSRSCLTCEQCMTGYHNRCLFGEDVIVGRYGGFADKVHCQDIWAIPLPKNMNLKTAGPLFCGGITVFTPIYQNNIKATDHVGVIGIGGLGHMALKFLKSWGCEVTAFSTSPQKEKEAREFGAHHFVNTTDSDSLKSLENRFNMILVTSNVDLDWNGYVNALKPGGNLHIVGAAGAMKTLDVFPLISGQKSISGSPIGNPSMISKMLEFCYRHNIEPMIEEYPMSEINQAFDRLKSGKARYRIVLNNDFK